MIWKLTEQVLPEEPLAAVAVGAAGVQGVVGGAGVRQEALVAGEAREGERVGRGVRGEEGADLALDELHHSLFNRHDELINYPLSI